jgi:predicted metalloendopeptidase
MGQRPFQPQEKTAMTRLVFSFMALGALVALPMPALAGPPGDAPQAIAPGNPAAPSAFAGRDLAVSPGADFFANANGGWLRDTPIPADRSSTGVFDELQELADRRTADLIREAALAPAAYKGATGEIRQVGDYFSSYLDQDAIEARGLAPVQPALEQIAAIGDRTALASALGRTLRADVDVLNDTRTQTPNILGLWIAQDLDQPSRYLPFILQGGLGMPDREYYLDDKPRMAALRASYRDHIAAVLALAGTADARGAAERILALETRIAAVHAPLADTEDVRKGDNHWSRARFDTAAPGLDWNAYFAAAGLQQQSEFVVWHPQAVSGIAALAGSEPLDTWKEYLRFHCLDTRSGVLPRAFDIEHFHFYETALSGTPQQRERWKRAVDATNDALGEAVGRLYVDRYFPASEKARAEQMVRNIVAAFARRIDQLDWMAPQTRSMAKAKLANLKVGVGYPDHWRDYSGLAIARGDAYGNRERAQLFTLRGNLAKLGTPVDRGEWVMNPQLVNAVNLPVMNAIQFPAAILQPPFFSADNTDAMNYGATGAVIGHEISHSFDDQGALFDAEGRLRNWWTPDDFAHFTASGAALAQQFDGYRPFPDLAVNGRQTLGENIADLAGLAAAYDAYRQSLGGRAAPARDGLSGDQQFFLRFAQFWRNKAREAALRRQVITNGHAPAEYRADTVRNIDAWYAAFAVKPGESLYLAPAQRVRVW